MPFGVAASLAMSGQILRFETCRIANQRNKLQRSSSSDRFGELVDAKGNILGGFRTQHVMRVECSGVDKCNQQRRRSSLISKVTIGSNLLVYGYITTFSNVNHIHNLQ